MSKLLFVFGLFFLNFFAPQASSTLCHDTCCKTFLQKCEANCESIFKKNTGYCNFCERAATKCIQKGEEANATCPQCCDEGKNACFLECTQILNFNLCIPLCSSCP